MALDVIRRNNNELVRAVERAKTVTVSSLRTAVTVAGALYNQKLVLMLKTQGVEIQKNASEAMISTDTLRKSFADTLQALDDISSYKLEALPRMRQTIEEFRQLADEGTKKLDQMEEAGRFVLESPAEPEQEKLPQ